MEKHWKENSQSGSVLISVIWVISTLAILVVSLGSRCIWVLGLTDRLEQQLQASYIARGAVQRALKVLAEDPTPSVDGLNEAWLNSETSFARQPLGGGQFTFSYRDKAEPDKERFGFLDEERKLNLNTVPVEVLRKLLEQVGGLKEAEILTIADSILDWRDPNQDKRPYGAESFYYLGLQESYECKDAPFENVEELLFIRGVTPELFSRVAPYLTVYGSGKVNLNTATRTVLKGLGFSEQGVDGIVFYRAGEDNTEGTSDDRTFHSISNVREELARVLPVENLNRLGELEAQQLLAVRSRAFRLSVVAQAADQQRYRIRLQCVVDRNGQILAWSEQ